MAHQITDECIACDACVAECPDEAFEEGSTSSTRKSAPTAPLVSTFAPSKQSFQLNTTSKSMTKILAVWRGFFIIRKSIQISFALTSFR